MKEKILYTNCQYGKCGKELAYPSTIRKYCNNNNKCKNDFHNSVREVKVAWADQIIDLLALSEEYERKLDLILGNDCIQTISYDYLEMMGIDLSCELLKVDFYDDEITLLILSFENYHFHYSVLDNEVCIWKNNFSAEN